MDKYVHIEDLKYYLDRQIRAFEPCPDKYDAAVGIYDGLYQIPVADVVKVVRCGECEFWERDRISCEGMARCKTGESGVRFRSRNDYCSRGILMHKDGDGE